MKIHAYYSNRDKFYIVSELLTGGELFDRIQDLDGFGEKEAAGVMQQLLRALIYMHERNVVHRDLKPENLVYCDTKYE